MSATIEQMMFDGQKHLPQQRSFCEEEQAGCSSMLLLCLVEQTAEQIAYEIGVDGMEDVSFREFVDLVKTTTLSNNSNSSSSNSNSNTSQKDSFDIELLVEHDILRDRSTSVLRRIYYSSLMNPTTSNDGNTRKENPPTTTMKEDPPTATIAVTSTNDDIHSTDSSKNSTTPQSSATNISFLPSPLALSRDSTSDSSWSSMSELQYYADSPSLSLPSPQPLSSLTDANKTNIAALSTAVNDNDNDNNSASEKEFLSSFYFVSEDDDVDDESDYDSQNDDDNEDDDNNSTSSMVVLVEDYNDNDDAKNYSRAEATSRSRIHSDKDENNIDGSNNVNRKKDRKLRKMIIRASRSNNSKTKTTASF